MTEPREDKKQVSREELFKQKVGEKADRKMRARRERERNALYFLGMFGLVGWSVAIPTLIGIAFGVWLDKMLQDRVSWTLTFLLIGILLGCLNAWYWIKKEGRHD